MNIENNPVIKGVMDESIVNLVLVVSEDCRECSSLSNKLKVLQKMQRDIKLQEYNIGEFNNANLFPNQIKVFITPALFVNKELKLYGDAEIKKLYQLITI